MRVDRFDFELPKELIAKSPVTPRDAARLLEVFPDSLNDSSIANLPGLLSSGDVLVFNDTKVLPARLKGKRGLAGIEVTLHKKLSENCWKAFAKPAKKLKEGDTFTIADDFHATVTAKHEDGQVSFTFNKKGAALETALEQHGAMPLPPYISRPSSEEDKQTYQTIFAKHSGAVAAPTAGLHFTENLQKKIAARGILSVYLTLHVGGGTFLPVKSEDTKDHVMHSEECILSKETADFLNTTRKRGGRIVAVGTTALRTLETAADEKGILHPFKGETDIFITPGYRFKAVDLLFTNFHLPRSTLFMLVCAFAGEKQMHRAYRHAIDEKYRFYSYGDAMLLHKMDT